MAVDTLFEGHRSTLHRTHTSLNRDSNVALPDFCREVCNLYVCPSDPHAEDNTLIAIRTAW